MPTLTVKNVPPEVYRRLKERAERHRRSLNSEAIVCLENSLGVGPRQEEELMARVRALRAEFPGRVTEEELRKAIDEGRP